MILSHFELDLDRYPERVEATWDQLAASLVHAPATPCTTETCGKGEHELHRERKDGSLYSVGCRHKYGPAWSPAEYPEGATRAKAAVARVHALVLDFDHVKPADLPGVLARLDGFRVVVHSTHSDRHDERALRAVVALSRPVLGAEWPRFWAAAVASFGVPADPAACDASRLYFLPTHPSDVAHLHAAEDGRALDVDAILALAPAPLPERAPTGASEHDRPPASAALLAAVLQRLERHGPAISGDGGDQHTFAACAIARHDFALSREEALDVLTMWDRANVPPWGRAGIVEKLDNAESYASGERGAERDRLEVAAEMRLALTPSTPAERLMTAATAGDDFAILLGQALADVTEALGSAEASGVPGPLFVPASVVVGAEYAPTPWLVRDLLMEGGVGALATEPKSAKTWAALELALAVATGTRAFGFFETGAPRRVGFFFAEDMAAQVATRIGALGKGRNGGALDLSRLFLQPRGRFLDLTRDLDVALIVASVRRLGGVDFLVLDPLRDIHGAEEDKSDAMSNVMRRIKLIGELLSRPGADGRATACTVLFVHHSKKASGNGKPGRPGQQMRGSSAIHGSVDSGIYFTDLEGNGRDVFTNTVISEVKGARGAGVFALTLRIEDGPNGTAVRAAWSVDRTEEVQRAKAEAKEGEEDAKVLDVVRTLAARHDLMTPTDTRNLIKGDRTKIRDAIARLKLRGALEEVVVHPPPDHKPVRVLAPKGYQYPTAAPAAASPDPALAGWAGTPRRAGA